MKEMSWGEGRTESCKEKGMREICGVKEAEQGF